MNEEQGDQIINCFNELLSILKNKDITKTLINNLTNDKRIIKKRLMTF